jgi:hypothetical protein
MKSPGPKDRGTIAGRATIAERNGAFSSDVGTGSREENALTTAERDQLADGAAG